MNKHVLTRITTNPARCGGQPCLRGMRIRVADILAMLEEGVDRAGILADFPDLQADDLTACLSFAAQHGKISSKRAAVGPRLRG